MTRAATLIAERAQDYVQSKRRLSALKGIRSMADETGRYVAGEIAKEHVTTKEMKPVLDGLAVIRGQVERLLK